MAKSRAKKQSKAKKMTAKEQSARFVAMVKEVEADESGETFEKVFKKPVPAKSSR
jgi:hypothetical protein